MMGGGVDEALRPLLQELKVVSEGGNEGVGGAGLKREWTRPKI